MKTKKIVLVFSLIVFLSHYTYSQCDIISNWNFETKTGCPNALSQIAFASGWFDANAIGQIYPSADYYNCSFLFAGTGTLPGTPPSGTGFIGLNVAGESGPPNGGAEMIGTFANLCQGVTYTLSFFSKGGFNLNLGTQPLFIQGVNTGGFPVASSPQFCPTAATTLLTIPKSQVYNTNWTLRTFTFTSPANFNAIIIGGVCGSTDNYYIYIDDFRIQTSNGTANSSTISSTSIIPCGGGNASITFNLPIGCAAPFNVTYTVNGTPFTINNINNGHVISIPISSSTTIILTNVVDNNGCVSIVNSSITIAPSGSAVSASWTNPSPICAAAGSINLNTLITGTAGGTWSGTGVSGATFNPSVGTQSITYTVGTAPCQSSSVQTITVNPVVNPSWTNPSSICAAAGSINLNTLITGTAGGTWSGTGVAGTTFNPASGTQSVTYTVGLAPCIQTLAQTITVVPDVNPAWTNPGPLCAATGGTVTLVPTQAGGTFSGTGVTAGGVFSLSAGTQSITYTIGSAPCIETSTQTITVNPIVNPAWTNPSPICAAAGSINLNTLITGTPGGTWSGTGVAGTTFNPASGTQSVTYVVGTAPCQEVSTQTITVVPDVNPAWTNPTPICAAAGSINLNALITGTTGGTWSGTGVSGNNFDPSVGSQSITYSVGSAPCIETSVQTITVMPDVDPSWTNPSPVCAAAGSINLNNLITGTTGGTWSGTGVTGNTFNPSVGTQSITYTVGTAPCIETLTFTINVSAFDASWTNPSPICDGASAINLNTLVTGSGGGTFTGTGVTTNTFDPTGLGGTTVNITYTVGATPCTEVLTLSVVVNPAPIITVPNGGVVCEGNTINLLPSTGGTWTSSNPAIATIDNAGLVTGISAGNATMTFTDATTGCSSIGTTGIITVNPLPIITVPNGGVVCEGSTINLLPSTGGTWTSSNPAIATIDNAGLVTGISAGNATMTFTDSITGCTSSAASGIITVNPAPIITVPNGGVVCEGITINLLPSTGGTWTSSNPAIATIDNTGLVTGISAGNTTMTFTDATTGCSSIGTAGIITVNPLPIITVPNGGVVCEGSTINLLPSTGGTWTSSNPAIATIDNAGLVTGISAGNATMTFTDAITGCSSIASSGIITVNPAPIITAPLGGAVCQGSTINLLPSTGGTWTSSNPAIATIDNTGLVTGILVDTVTMVFIDSITGCASIGSSGTIIVGGGQAAISAFPITGLVPLDVVFGNGSIINVSCFWDFGDGSTDTLCNPSHIYQTSGSYVATLIVTDIYGCPDTITTIIDVNGESSILIPNVFTPNGDGNNDFFFVDGVNLTTVEGEIFNRWGQKMFAWDNVKGKWDGRTLSGSEAPSGTYFYIIKAKGIDEKEFFQKGTLSLFR